MRKILLTCIITIILATTLCAQKEKTYLGDAITGEVTATNDNTREISIKYDDKDKTETFVGILKDAYQVKMKDGTRQELMISQIPLGTRVRVFYKTKEKQDVRGQKVDVKEIFRIDFLGKDEYAKLRETLTLDPLTVVSLVEANNFPPANPLKIYLATTVPFIKEDFTKWINEWNKEDSKKYGLLKLVDNYEQSDISLVVYLGTEKTVVTLPMVAYINGEEIPLWFSTAFLTYKEGNELKVLWKQGIAVSTKISLGLHSMISKEIEKRMKARAKASKKQ